jgi:Tfp pilus assembly protein PilO
MRIEGDQVKTALVVAALAAVFVFALWMPTQNRKKELQQQLQAAQHEAQSRSKDAKGMVELVEQVNELETLAKRDDHYVPAQDELAELLSQLTSGLTTQGIQNVEIKTDPIERYGKFNVMPVALRFRGSFQSVFQFLKHVESMRRLVRVTSVDIQPPMKDRGDNKLDVRVQLSTFFQVSEGAPRS